MNFLNKYQNRFFSSIFEWNKNFWYSVLNSKSSNIYSGPDAPILDTIITAQSDTVFSFFPSYGNDLNYQIEYYPINNAQQQSIVFETKATHIALTDLRPNTEYTLKITTKYHGIQSDDATITTFKTKGMFIVLKISLMRGNRQFILLTTVVYCKRYSNE